jgi:hypothetical protein
VAAAPHGQKEKAPAVNEEILKTTAIHAREPARSK